MWDYIVIADTNFPVNTEEEIDIARYTLAQTDVEKAMIYRMSRSPQEGGSFEDSIALGFYILNYAWGNPDQ